MGKGGGGGGGSDVFFFFFFYYVFVFLVFNFSYLQTGLNGLFQRKLSVAYIFPSFQEVQHFPRRVQYIFQRWGWEGVQMPIPIIETYRTCDCLGGSCPTPLTCACVYMSGHNYRF